MPYLENEHNLMAFYREGEKQTLLVLGNFEKEEKILEEKEIRAQKQSPNEWKSSLRGEILFNQICFSYSEGKEVLKGLNLRVKEGEKVVLLGTSGSGKSSILKILMGMERAQSGTIRIGGQDTMDCLLYTSPSPRD